jgi:hypothetical protein
MAPFSTSTSMGHLTLHVAQTLKIFFVVETDISPPSPKSSSFSCFMLKHESQFKNQRHSMFLKIRVDTIFTLIFDAFSEHGQQISKL